MLFPLEIPQDERDSLVRLLSADERDRAARFRFAEHAARYVVAHGQLRRLLAPLLQCPPESIALAAGAHGKPELADAAATSGLRFNLSHSAEWGLVGWAWQHEIGVDVECWRPMHDEAALVRRFFSPAEIAAYEALPLAARHKGFFDIWTRKEAYVKAVGRGLGLALDSFDVSLEEGAGARLLRPSALLQDERPWSLAAPVAAPDLSLAVVLQSEMLSLAPIDAGV